MLPERKLERIAREILLDAVRKRADMTDGPESWPHRGEEGPIEAAAKERLAGKQWRALERAALAAERSKRPSEGKLVRLVPNVGGARLVHCKYCNKTHAVVAGETPCAPGAWGTWEKEKET